MAESTDRLDERHLRRVPEWLAPAADELAVLSLIAVRAVDDHWAVATGSLLSVPREVALISWRAWRARQPRTRGGPPPTGFDLGPIFDVQPFPGLRAIRRVLGRAEWEAAVDGIGSGWLDAGTSRLSVSAFNWVPAGLIASRGIKDAHHVVAGIRRPVTGVAATLAHPEHGPHHSDGRWDWTLPLNEPPGPARGDMFRNRHLANWPLELVGVDWVGSDEFELPALFVVGRPTTDAWIADVNVKSVDEVVISIRWDADRIDPLSCSATIRSQHAQLVLMEHHIRISDLPNDRDATQPEPRTMAWHERALTVTMPRGAPHTPWGMSLFAPDGHLLDERETGRRFEGGHVHTEEEMDDAVRTAEQLVTDARKAAAERRLSSIGDLERYLRGRFAFRNGELLLLDPHLFSGDADRIAATIDLLTALHRPVRALCNKVPPDVASQLLSTDIDPRLLPHGKATLHDRVWIVGDTGLLVGGSINTFAGTGRRPETTATELPFADVSLWRDRFTAWWPQKRPAATQAVSRRSTPASTPRRTSQMGEISIRSIRRIAALARRLFASD